MNYRHQRTLKRKKRQTKKNWKLYVKQWGFNTLIDDAFVKMSRDGTIKKLFADSAFSTFSEYFSAIKELAPHVVHLKNKYKKIQNKY